MQSSVPDQTSMILLSLHTLSTFEFDFQLTQMFVHKVLTHYLENENPLIRKKAAITCIKLLLRKEERLSLRKTTVNVILDVIDRLLKACLTELGIAFN
jgi:FKBP12-rapamycin complex-associated protein